jgi:hypothetical protein
MTKRVVAFAIGLVALLMFQSAGDTQGSKDWNSAGLSAQEFKSMPPGGAAPRRDLSGLWDAGTAGVGGAAQEGEREAARAPFTPRGLEMVSRNKPGNGPRAGTVAEINDPLSTLGDPTGFPRIVNFELRPFQIVQTPTQVLMLYMFEHRWRVIWTDGRPLPKDPDPRWYGYSVGRWEDDYTLVVDTVGMRENTWVDNSGDPHSYDLRVQERYHRVNRTTLELTVVIDDPQIYTKPWMSRNRLVMRLMPTIDLMEMIPSASEAQLYRESISSLTK